MNFIFDIVANIRDGKVYKGNSFFQGDILFNIQDNIIYNGDSISSFDIIARIEDGKVYNEQARARNIVLFNFDGELTLEEFVAVWFMYHGV
jgi:hypothetical protein